MNLSTAPSPAEMELQKAALWAKYPEVLSNKWTPDRQAAQEKFAAEYIAPFEPEDEPGEDIILAEPVEFSEPPQAELDRMYADIEAKFGKFPPKRYPRSNPTRHEKYYRLEPVSTEYGKGVIAVYKQTPKTHPEEFVRRVVLADGSAEKIDRYKKTHGGKMPPNIFPVRYEFTREDARLFLSSLPEEWHSPVPLGDELTPVRALDKNILPAGLRPWVTDVAERMSVPIDFSAVCALSVLAGVTGRRVFVYPKANDKDWKEAICLSGAVVAGSGRSKTPTWAAFTKPVEAVAAEWEQEFRQDMAKYLEAMSVWKKVQKKNERAEAAGKPEDIVLLQKPEGPPVRRRLVLNDATPEVMHDIMKPNPSGLLYFRDELSGWSAEMDMVGRESQRTFFLSAMNGNDVREVDRIGRDGGNATMCLTVFGSFQPDLLREFLFASKNIADGTVPRFSLLVWPDEYEAPKVDLPVNAEAKKLYYHLIRTLAQMGPESIQFHFSPDAQKLFYKFMNDLDKGINTQDDEGKRSHLAKYNGTLPKLAALFQLIDLVASATRVATLTVDLLTGAETKGEAKVLLSGSHVIDIEHYTKALKFLLYLESHMHRVYDSKRNPIQQAGSTIARRIKSRDLRDGFTVRDIQRKRWVESRDNIEMALEDLAEKGWIREQAAPAIRQPGQPARRWDINPELK